MKKEIYKIYGMHCASCVLTIEKELKKISGVKSANVNFANESVSIEFDKNTASEEKFRNTLASIGYHLATDNKPDGHHDHMAMGDNKIILKVLKVKLLVGVVLSVIIFLGSFPEWFPFVPAILNNLVVLLILTIPVQFWVGWEFYRGITTLIKHGRADMDTLISIGTLSAFFYSVAVVILFDSGSAIMPTIYFDTSAIIVTLIILGRYLEAKMKGRASEAIKKLIGLQPKTAKVIKDGKEIEILIGEVGVDDLIIVRPGEKIPVDGKITDGDSEIDESMITGESMPIHKREGDLVIGGSINKFGTFTFMATKIGKDTVLAQIIKMVEQAQGSKAPIQRLADLVSSYFVPVVLAVAILTFILWYLLGPSPAFNFALVNFVAVLIIACPCALGLATPMAIIISTGSAAKKGILIKDAESLEVAHKINAVIFDKTGTLTVGKPQLTDIIAFSGNKKSDILSLAASLEQRSEHPLAQAILKYAGSLSQKSSHPLDKAIKDEIKKENIDFLPLKDFKAIPGKGVNGLIDNKNVYLGGRALADDLDIDISIFENDIQKLESEGKTVMILIVEKEIRGALAVADVLKEEAKEAVLKLKNKKIEVWMITGDNERTAKAIAREVGIEKIMSQVLPENKVRKVEELQKQGKMVAMIGDGINDAPALTQAHLGIAMGEGTDIAMESANITLMRGNLNLIPEILGISNKTLSIIKQNLFWAFFYNIAFIPVAAGVLYPPFGILLNPIFASAAMAFSSISVVLNSLRLRRI